MNLLLFFLVTLLIAGAAVGLKKLTPTGGLTGAVLAAVLFFGLSWWGLVLMGAFFVLGTGATAWQKSRKLSLGIAPENKRGRTAGQVLANGGMGGAMAACAIFFPEQESLWLLLTAAAFSSATADTLSSELGSVYGRQFVDVLTLRPGRRGDDGVVSLEGLLAGMAGSAAIAGLHAAASGWGKATLVIVLAGTIGNLADSVLGATLERRGRIDNDAVNFLNTAAAVLTAWLVQAIT